MGHSWPIFAFIIQLKGNKKFKKKLPIDWIQTIDLWDRKRPLYQLSHDHCPKLNIVSCLQYYIHIIIAKTVFLIQTCLFN